TAHEFTSEEARNAGKKGGERVSANRSHMIEIGRLGGKRSAARRRENAMAQSGNGARGASGRSHSSATAESPSAHRQEADRNGVHPGEEVRQQTQRRSDVERE